MRLRQVAIPSVCITLILIAIVVNSAIASTTEEPAKRVKIVGNSVELIEITPTAPKCGKQKGETVRFRVTSETPIDVRLYVQAGFRQWVNRDFANQKKGDEISEYRCDQKPVYKIYSHAAGSSEAWPKP